MRCKCGERIDIDLEWQILRAVPVAFHPYTSYVQERIVAIRGEPELCEEMSEILLEKFNEVGIKAWPDNKIVFECTLYEKPICFGFYDGDFSIGFSYYNEHEERRKLGL